MVAKTEDPLSLSMPREFFSEEGQQDAIAFAKGSRLTSSQSLPAILSKSLLLSGVTMNDTFTNVTANAQFQIATNGSAFFRPDFESHLFFETHWIIRLTSGGTAPAGDLTIELQTWLNKYHVLISPSGFANDWNIRIPAGIMGANQAFEFNQTFVGGIFNLEFRRTPNAHLIEFMYRAQTVPSGWSNVDIKPRITMLYAIPSSQISFVNV